MKKPIRTKICLLFLFGLLLSSSAIFGQTRTITGTVVDEKGELLPFVGVAVPGSTIGASTDLKGRFSLTMPEATKIIEVSFIGFKTLRVELDGRADYDIRLENEAFALEAVVVVGNIERKKESFTGAFNTVSGSELRQIGSQNLVQSLRSLDASFVVLENIAAGANPNAMPTIEIRGQTSINFSEVGSIYDSDPNMPLFILDGFETTLQKIVDLDPNRVVSVSILKDAASTAFYGSRAANGVVVVETVKGQSGRLRVFYGGDMSVEFPNINSYNMMNAEEKLRFELLSGRYNFPGEITNMTAVNEQMRLDAMYAERLAEVQRGVDSDWLSEPLRTVMRNRHSIRVTGGSDELMVDGAFSWRNFPGVMKGSKRDSWTGDVDITYRKGKFSFVNLLGVSGYTAIESPYGSFYTWVGTNPYYRKYDEHGDPLMYLAEVYGKTYYPQTGLWGPLQRQTIIPNPLYNATLQHSKNESRNFDFNERFRARWDFYQGMRVEGLFQLTSGNVNRIRFVPPEHTDFEDRPLEEKGTYRNEFTKNLSYTANLLYTWINRIDKHSYVLNARGEIGHQNITTSIWEAIGFPYNANGEPSHANRYALGRPTYNNPVSRRANFLVSANYDYNGRYLFDATFRYDGSTVFGSAKKFTSFWSSGVGWNLHEEDFLKPVKWISNLRLRATIGQTGNQNVGTVTSSSILSYLPGGNIFGSGLMVLRLGNPYIDWPKTTTTNLAMDLSMFDHRFVGKFEVYQKRTSPLVVMVDQPMSTGVLNYAMSLGELTYRGFEFEGTHAVIRQRDITWRLRLMGAVLDGKYSGFSDKLKSMNQAAQESNTLARFKDGFGPKTLWAVRSLGIDPATGREVFLDRFNMPTFVYNPADIRSIGKGEPRVSGTISSFFTYKKMTLTVVMRYSLGEEVFNGALYNKVENISMSQVDYNQDRRALTDRWKQPGDISQFKGISLTGSTPMSSRFIQTENYLSGESIGLMWRFDKNSWIRYLKMENLTLNATAGGTAGAFKLSNVKRERGTSYAEAGLITLAINAVF